MSLFMGEHQGASVMAKVMPKNDCERQILAIATDAFDNEEKAWRWLHEPNLQTGNKPPIEVIDTQQGFKVVQVVLNQIKYGIFA